jgi:hypothetical protein
MRIYAQHKTHKTKISAQQNQNLIFAMSNYIKFLMIQNMTHMQQTENSSPNSHKNENTQHANKNPSRINMKNLQHQNMCDKKISNHQS